jgi:class 3 adenylate cyclase
MLNIQQLFNKFANTDKTDKTDKHGIINVMCVSICLRNFSVISSEVSLIKLANLMQHFYSTIAEVTLKNHGDIDRFCGDSVMIFFRQDVRLSEDAALEFGKGVIDKLYKYGDLMLDIGVGISGGEIIYGEFGSDSRATVTGFGHPINCAIQLARNNSGVSKEMR